MAKAGYGLVSPSITLSASTAKTGLMVICPSSFGIDVKKVSVSFDGVTATNPPVLVEFVTSTNATNSTPGTNNTSESANIQQLYGRSITTGFTAFSNSTSEPTVLTVVRRFLLSPVGGTVLYDWPLGDTPDTAVSSGFGIRFTPGGTISANARAELIFERC